VAITLGVSCIDAQVTIGGDEAPPKGSLLSLNSDMRGGLQLSNVALSTDLTVIPNSFPGMSGLSGTALDDAKEEFKGAMVYNTNISAGQGEGVYTWNGEKWNYVNDNTRYFAVPDYAQGGPFTNGQKADRSGFVICTWESTQGSIGTGVWIDGDRVIGSDYTNTDATQEAIVPISVGQVLTINSSGVVGATFYPPLFVQRHASNSNDSYSLEEIKTNDVWLDDKPIYKKTVYSGDYSIEYSGVYTVVSNVFPSTTYVDKVLKVEGYGYSPINDAYFGFIGSWNNWYHNWNLSLCYVKDDNKITLTYDYSPRILYGFTVTLYYTKN
jgi:hypothetical protein